MVPHSRQLLSERTYRPFSGYNTPFANGSVVFTPCAGYSLWHDMARLAADGLGARTPLALSRLPTTYVMTHHLAPEHHARLYKAADCFVLPTRGEVGSGVFNRRAICREGSSIKG